MNIKPYFVPILKWWWLILGAVLLAVGTSYFFVRDQQPSYASRTTLLIGRALTDPNPTGNDMYLNQQLATLYVNMAYTDPVRTGAMEELGLSWLPPYEAAPAGNSQFIQITVTDTDPVRAQSVAAELARQLIRISPSGGGDESQRERQAFIDSQVSIIQQQILETEGKISEQQVALGTISSAVDLEQAQADLEALENRLALLRTNYANLVSSMQTVATNSLHLLEPASLPDRPVGLSPTMLIVIAGIIGLVLSVGAAYLIEVLDTTLNSPEDVVKYLGSEPIGFLQDAGSSKTKVANAYVYRYPDSRLAEGFRSLRVNLDYAHSDGRTIRSILVTSPTPGDGKSTVAINLALIFAKSGRRVILVDADLRRPSIHRYLNMERNPGMADLLADPTLLRNLVIPNWEDTDLQVLPSGSSLDEYLIDKLLTPEKLNELVLALEKRADLIIIDSPPIMISDAMALASSVDGVLMVVRPGFTQRELGASLITNLKKTGAQILGVVMNRIPFNQLGVSDSYRYHIPYYYNRYKHKGN